MPLQEGDPIWVESIMTHDEWVKRHKTYRTSKIPVPVPMFECEFKWRYRMGGFLTSEEIQLINARLDYIKEQAGLNQLV